MRFQKRPLWIYKQNSVLFSLKTLECVLLLINLSPNRTRQLPQQEKRKKSHNIQIMLFVSKRIFLISKIQVRPFFFFRFFRFLRSKKMKKNSDELFDIDSFFDEFFFVLKKMKFVVPFQFQYDNVILVS